MRVILTLIAVALVSLLTAALIVPYFIDWSAHRADIAERLEALTGGQVTLSGPVTLRLLPTPYLEVGAGSAAMTGADAPRLAFDGARLELALVKLASGAFRFTDVRLMKPVLTLTRAANGALIVPSSASTPPEAVGADRFSVRDGTIRIAAKGSSPEWTISGVELDGDAPTLAGPYHVSGQASGPDGAQVVFRLASEKAGSGGAPVRIAVEAGPTWPELEFDGRLTRPEGGGPAALGAAVITGTSPGVDGPMPWRATGKLAADLDGATLTGAEFRFGPEDRALHAEGTATLAFQGSARLAIDAKAKQANVDGLLRRKGEDAVPPSRAVAALSAALAPALAGASGTRLDAHVAVETVILGGDTLSGLSAALQAKPGASPIARIELGLPGRSRIKAEGEVETGADARFIGAIDFSSADPGALGRWAGQGAPELIGWTEALDEAVPASSSLAVSGRVDADAAGVSSEALRIALGRSVLSGALAVTRPVGTDPGRITAALAADSLDLDTLPSLDATRSLVGDYDLSLSLDAKALSLAHVGDAAIEGASLALKVGRSGKTLTLDRLAIAGLGGASVEATGAAGPDGVTASGRLDAQKLADFSALVSRLAPGPWTRTLAQRAPLLSPASIAFEARGGPVSDGAPALQALKATGTLAGTKAALGLAPAGKGDGQTLSLTLDSPDSGALLRQLGVGAPPPPSVAALKPSRDKSGRLTLNASGAWGSGYDFDAAASLAGAALSGRGRYAPTAEGDDARLFGALKIAGDDVAPFAALVGLAPGGGPIGPVDVSADVTLRGARWNLSRIAGAVAGVKASGALAYEAAVEGAERVASPDLQRAEDVVNGPGGAQPTAPATLTGELSFDRLRFADLAALALGPPQPIGAGKSWSEAKFAAPPLNPPAAAVQVHVGTLNLADGLAAQGFSTSLRYDRGRLDLDDLAMRVDGGAVSGRATLRRSGETATIDGALAVEPVPVTRPGLSGRIGARLDFASTGRSTSALIAGLAGGGTAEFAGADPPAQRSRRARARRRRGAGARGRDRRDERRLPVRRRARQRRARDPRRTGAARAERRDDQGRPDRRILSTRRGDAERELRLRPSGARNAACARRSGDRTRSSGPGRTRARS